MLVISALFVTFVCEKRFMNKFDLLTCDRVLLYWCFGRTLHIPLHIPIKVYRKDLILYA